MLHIKYLCIRKIIQIDAMKAFHYIIILLLVIFTGIAYIMQQKDPSLDFITLLVANIMMFLLSFISFSMISTSLRLKGGDALYRSKITSTMMKFVVIIGSLLFYHYATDNKIGKSLIFFTFGLYIAYNFAETYFLSKLAKTNNPDHPHT